VLENITNLISQFFRYFAALHFITIELIHQSFSAKSGLENYI